MNPVLQIISRGRKLRWLLLSLSFMAGLSTTLHAQCPAGQVSTTTVYPISAASFQGAAVQSGNVNNIVVGGNDGILVRADGGIVLDFGEQLPPGGKLVVRASGVNGSYKGNFWVDLSSNNDAWESGPYVSVPAGTTMNDYTIDLSNLNGFRYLKLTSDGAVVTAYTYFDAVKVTYTQPICRTVPKMTDCIKNPSASINTVWRYFEPDAAVATTGLTMTPALNGPDGLNVDLTTSTQSFIVQFPKWLSAGDTIMISGFKYSTAQPGDFTVSVSWDGTNFTALPAFTFTNNAPLLQQMKVVATEDFRYIKVARSGTGQVSIDAISVKAKACASLERCNLNRQTIAPQAATATTVQSGSANSVLVHDGTAVGLYNGQSLTVDFGREIQDADVSIVASTFSASYNGNFDVYWVSSGGSQSLINPSITTSGTIPTTGTAFQTYHFHNDQYYDVGSYFSLPVSFRYLVIKAKASNYVKIDYIGLEGIDCPMCTVNGTASTTQATCSPTGGANSDAKLILDTYFSATKAGYSLGSTYTGPAFASATSLTAAPMTLVSTLANPAAAQPYTVRFFTDAYCYTDVVATLNSTKCPTSDLSLKVSPSTSNGAKGDIVTYTVTLTNAGPDAAPNVTVSVPIPKNMTYILSKTSQGNYDTASTIWNLGTVAVGSQTIIMSLQYK